LLLVYPQKAFLSTVLRQIVALSGLVSNFEGLKGESFATNLVGW